MNKVSKIVAPTVSIADAEGPHPVDQHVGQRLRLRRTMLGVSQESLAASIGLTFQQVQKYERGSNRISASKLFSIAKALNTPISFFFAGADSSDYTQDATVQRLNLAESINDIEYGDTDPFSKQETLELVTAYYRIADPAMRLKMLELIQSLAADIPGRKPGALRKKVSVD